MLNLFLSQVCDSSERLIKSPIVTGNLFSDGKMPTTPGGRGEMASALVSKFLNLSFG